MNPITVLNRGNVPTGPFTRAQIAEKLQSGEMALTDLAFVEGVGFSQWTPLRDVLARIDGTGAVVPAPPVAVPPATAPAYSYAATMAPPAHLIYGGFWLRFVAYLLDGLILSVVALVFAFFIAIFFIMIGAAMGMSLKQIPGTNSGSPNPVALILIGLMYLIIYGGLIVVTWLYFAKLESGPAQATYGKQVMGLRVTDLTGQRIGFGRASGRFFGKIVSGMTFYVGFIMAGFTERKQALHDMIAGTLVVKG